MRLSVNGEQRETGAATVAELWQEVRRALPVSGPQGVAIARNSALVRKEHWPHTRLADGDRIEIIQAVQGG